MKNNSNFLLDFIEVMLSDILFNQQFKSFIQIDIIIIVIQFILLFGMLITNCIIILSMQTKLVILGIDLILCLFVIINNYIHKKIWYRSKKELNRVFILLSIYKDYEIDMEKYYDLLSQYNKTKLNK